MLGLESEKHAESDAPGLRSKARTEGVKRARPTLVNEHLVLHTDANLQPQKSQT